MDNLEVIREKFKKDNFAKGLGIIMDELTKDSVKMHMELKPDMNNFHGKPHGAAIYGLADVAFSVLGNNQNNVSVALDCTITYHTAPEVGQILYVKGELVKQSRKIGTYLFHLYMMEKEKKIKVATMMSTLYRTGKPHDPNLKVE